jgi:hypothetical protein
MRLMMRSSYRQTSRLVERKKDKLVVYNGYRLVEQNTINSRYH